MIKIKLGRLSTHILLILVVCFYSQRSLANFVEDSTTTLRYANYPWMADRVTQSEGIPTTKQGEWVHALEMKYNSGYFNDVIGLDYGIYGLHTIATKDDATRTQNINGVDDNGHGGTNLLYLKLKAEISDFTLKGGYGKKNRSYENYKDFSFRIIEGTSVGGDMSLSNDNFSLYAAIIDKSSPHNKDYFGNSLKTFFGETIDYIGIYGVTYQVLDNLLVKAEHLEAKDYIERNFLSANYLHEINDTQSLTLNARYGTMSDAGKLFELTPIGPDGQYANDPDGLNTSFNEFSLTYTDSDLDYYATFWRTDVNGGDYNRVLFADSRGWWTNRTVTLWNWFGLEGETTWRTQMGLTLDKYGIPGLALQGAYAKSNHADGYQDFSRRDIQFAFIYNAQSPALRGLSIVFLHMDHLAAGKPDGTRRTGTGYGPAALNQNKAERIYINYVKTF